jgi:hypothetical protein
MLPRTSREGQLIKAHDKKSTVMGKVTKHALRPLGHSRQVKLRSPKFH